MSPKSYKLDRSLDKIDVFVCVHPLPEDVQLFNTLQGKFEDVRDHLKKLHGQIMELHFWDAEIVIEPSHDDIDLQVWAWRKETNTEFEERQRKIRRIIDREQADVLKRADKLETARVEAAAREAKEREILRILKEKYPE